MGGKRVFNPFRAPKPLPILIPSKFVPKKRVPAVKGVNRVRSHICGGLLYAWC